MRQRDHNRRHDSLLGDNLLGDNRRLQPLGRQRRGSAVMVVLLIVLSVSAMGIVTINEATTHVLQGGNAADVQSVQAISEACAAGASKAMPALLEVYMATLRATGQLPSIVTEQFDVNYLSTTPFGVHVPKGADCVIQIVDIATDLPAEGFSQGNGCFKRITLEATATLSRTIADSTDVTQQYRDHVGQFMIRGIFGPVSCGN